MRAEMKIDKMKMETKNREEVTNEAVNLKRSANGYWVFRSIQLQHRRARERLQLIVRSRRNRARKSISDDDDASANFLLVCKSLEKSTPSMATNQKQVISSLNQFISVYGTSYMSVQSPLRAGAEQYFILHLIYNSELVSLMLSF